MRVELLMPNDARAALNAGSWNKANRPPIPAAPVSPETRPSDANLRIPWQAHSCSMLMKRSTPLETIGQAISEGVSQLSPAMIVLGGVVSETIRLACIDASIQAAVVGSTPTIFGEEKPSASQ